MKTVIERYVKRFYVDVIYPMAEKFVKQTSNDWDDQFLIFLDQFVLYLIDMINGKKD